jgi:hypothetical protein
VVFPTSCGGLSGCVRFFAGQLHNDVPPAPDPPNGKDSVLHHRCLNEVFHNLIPSIFFSSFLYLSITWNIPPSCKLSLLINIFIELTYGFVMQL